MKSSSKLIIASAQGGSGRAQPMGEGHGFKDGQSVQEAICERTVSLALATYCGNLKSMILTGSLARQEGTFVCDADGWKQFGDAEFLLVFEKGAELPSGESLLKLQRAIESELLGRDLQCKISLAAVHPKYLRLLRPHIFAYELLTCGRVLWGEDVLSSIPRFPADAIPLEDAWRLLCNRMVELLEVSTRITDGVRELPKEVFYQTTKLYIDMGTSFLVFAGGYEPSYAGRAGSMRNLQTEGHIAINCPLNLVRFAERVIACTEYKLSGAGRLELPGPPKDESSLAFWREAIDDAHLLWRWELTQLIGTKDPLTDEQLMERWMRQQPIKEQLRGWLFVLRREGWHRSWRQWLGWIRCALRGSPRYCVYAVASALLFNLRALFAEGSEIAEAKSSMTEILSWLPARHAAPPVSQDWRYVTEEVVRNYHLFMVGTRA